MNTPRRLWFCLMTVLSFAVAPAVVVAAAAGPGSAPAPGAPLPEAMRWTCGAPLVSFGRGDGGHAIKDPTVVFHDGRWHVYATLKRTNSTIMVYLGFETWDQADAAPRVVLGSNETYRCAPQLLYFAPRRTWYLLHQWADTSRTPPFFGPAVSTLAHPGRPETLGPPEMLFAEKPGHVPRWIDFWALGDGTHMYLFFTGDDGRLWRSRTSNDAFPRGWSAPDLVLQQPKDDFFEANHVYLLKGCGQYLNIVEAIGPGGTRYYKSFLADRLDGEWRPAHASWGLPFASSRNVEFDAGVEPWTDAVSHGELLREGIDERLVVDPARLRFLFQGCTARECAGIGYGRIPWRIGLLEAAPPDSD